MSWEDVRAAGLAIPTVAPAASGQGVRIAVVDTGINFTHPHLKKRGRGVSIVRRLGEIEIVFDEFVDRHGHGTCCASLLSLLAPDVEIFAVRVTDDRPTTDADRLAEAIAVSVAEEALLVCIAMGTRTRLRSVLDDEVTRALARGTLVVAAAPDDEVLPAACSGAIAAHHEDGVDVIQKEGRLYAEGRARPAEGFRTNFFGASLATARIAAAFARTAELTQEKGEALVRGFSKLVEVR